MTKPEQIQALEARVAELRSEYYTAEWELEKLKGEGPLLDQFFKAIEASDRTLEEMIEFLKG